jgi:16S rRNA (adenine1518-N6/adenine1519-N6)-dimethyltransferase
LGRVDLQVHGLFLFYMQNSQSRGDENTLLAQTRTLLRRYNLRAKKGLGQNFLVDDAVLDSIIAAADLKPTDTIIEVGPGLGLMTAVLAKNAAWVIAIELDNRLADLLNENLPSDNIVVINQDVLGTDTGGLLQGRPPGFPPAFNEYKVVANLPYYITQPVIRHFLEASVKPDVMVLMVQKEVAQVICAEPGDRSMLSIAVQFYGRPEIVANVPGASFFPAPDVDSAVVKITVHQQPPVDVDNVDGFFKFVRAGFSAARKQVANSLTKGLGLPKPAVQQMLAKAGIAPERRAETFTLEEWAELWRIFSRFTENF